MQSQYVTLLQQEITSLTQEILLRQNEIVEMETRYLLSFAYVQGNLEASPRVDASEVKNLRKENSKQILNLRARIQTIEDFLHKFSTDEQFRWTTLQSMGHFL